MVLPQPCVIVWRWGRLNEEHSQRETEGRGWERGEGIGGAGVERVGQSVMFFSSVRWQVEALAVCVLVTCLPQRKRGQGFHYGV